MKIMTMHFRTAAYKVLSVLMVVALLFGSISPSMVFAVTDEDAVAEFNSEKYESLADAIAAIDDSYKSSGATPEKAAYIKLLKSTSHSFDVGVSNGSVTMNIALDLNGNTLTLKPAVGSVGTVSNGIRVLAYSKLAISNGTVVCSDAVEDNVKTGIANYGTLILDNVTLKSGALTIYTINNRGALTLSGATTVENGKVCQGDYGSKDNFVAITNDPYTLYYNNDAVINCDSDKVFVGNIQLEQYGSAGDVVLNISAGSFGDVTAPEAQGSVEIKGNITGGKFDSDISGLVADNTYITGDAENGFQVQKKAEQVNFGFKMPMPLDQWLGESFTNQVTGVIGTGETVYSIVSGSEIATIDAETGELTFSGIGSVTVSAENPGDDKTMPAKATYTVKAVKNRMYLNPRFENPTPGEIEYRENLVFENSATSDYGSEGVRYYLIASTGDATIDSVTGKLTINSAGDFTVTAIFPETDIYLETPTTYTLKVVSGTQDALTVTAPATVIYSPEAQNVISSVEGGSGTGSLVYSVLEGLDVATVDPVTGAITTLKEGTVKIGIEKKADANYNAASATVTITVLKAQQKELGFEKGNAVKVTWNDNATTFENPAINVLSTGKVEYEIISGTAASIDKDTGALTLVKAGEVQVKVTVAGDDRYEAATATYTLTVDKAAQSFSFTDGNAVEKKYGITEYKNTVKDEIGPGAISYSIVADKSDSIGASVNESTGVITIAESALKTGKITVKAVKAGNDQYAEYSAEYTLNLTYLTVASDVKPTLSGKIINDSGWYVDTVTVSAPEGFSISLSNSLNNRNTWKDSVEISTEDVNEVSVYLKNEAGSITDAIRLDDIKIDKTAPVDLSITFNESFVEKLLAGVTFGIFKAKDIEVTVSASDAVSGIYSITYYIGDTEYAIDMEEAAKNGNKNVTASFSLPTELRDQIRMVVTDVAGHSVEYKDGKTYVIDSKSPLLNVYYERTGSFKTANDVFYFNSDVVVHFAIEESNFDLVDSQPVVTIDGDLKLSLTWEFDEADSRWKASQTLSKEDTYSIMVEFEDASENKMEVYEQTICIDKTAPVINVSYDPADLSSYGNRKATIKITEANFDCADVVVDVIAKDIVGDDAAVSNDYAVFAMDKANWTTSGTEHTLVLPEIKDDAIYSFDVSYTDLADNAAADYEAVEFTVDNTAPVVVGIEYSQPVTEKIINALTFGFYSEKVKVTVTAEDATSGVDYMVITYAKNGDSATAMENASFVIENKDLHFSTDGKTAVAELYISKEDLDIDSDARGSIKAVVYDNAGLSSEQNDSNRINVVDTLSPEIEITYVKADGTDVQFIGADGAMKNTFAEAENAYFNGNVTANIVITEANFFEGADKDDDSIVHEVGIRLEKTDNDGNVTVYEYLPEGAENIYDDADENVSFVWTTQGDEHFFSIEYDKDADYKLTVEYADYSENEAEIEADDNKEAAKKYESKTVTVDKIAPVVEVKYFNENVIKEVGVRKYFNAKQAVEITVKEHNFRAADFVVVVEALDAAGIKDYNADISWDSNNNTHVATIEFNDNANYTFDYIFADLAANSPADYTEDAFTVDTVAPSMPVIEYSTPVHEMLIEALTFGFYKAQVEVTVTATDNVAGIDTFGWRYVKQDGASDINLRNEDNTVDENITYSDNGKTAEIKFTIPAQARGYITADATDRSENISVEANAGKIFVTDTLAPNITVKYSAKDTFTKVQYLNAANETVNSFAEAVSAQYDGAVVAEITIDEANFFEGNESGRDIIHNVGIRVVKTDENGKPYEYEYLPENSAKFYEHAEDRFITWSTDGDKHTITIEYENDGDYKLYVDYIDYSGNEADIAGNDGITVVKEYESKTVCVDKTAPVITVEYTNKNVIRTVGGRDYFNAVQTAIIKVEEHNFRASDFDADVTALDVSGKAVEDVTNYNAYLKNAGIWIADGDIYTAEIEFSVDANYTFDYNYYDLAGNPVEDYKEYEFTVDKANPSSVKIDYSTPVAVNAIEEFIYSFYSDKVKVTITVEDNIAGVDRIVYTYAKQDGTSAENKGDETITVNSADINYINAKTAVVEFVIDKNARGNISAVAYDRADNSDIEKVVEDIRVVDQLAPQISIEYVTAQTGTAVHYTDAQGLDADSFEEAANAYFNGDVVANIVINEANFFEGAAKENGIVHEVGIRLEKTDDDGNVTVYEYLPAGAENLYDDVDENVSFIWETQGDIHSFSIAYDENADYKLTVEYADYSENDAEIEADDDTDAVKTYESAIITVDKTAPVVTVDYQNKTVIHEIDNRKYYNAVQVAKITVDEHNFRPADFNATVTAKDVTTADVEVADYNAYLKNIANWKRNGNTYTAEIVFDVNANYAFDYTFIDLAQNAAQDYTEDVFAVDTTDPSDLKITYSANVAEKLLEALTFGFYKAEAVVTITVDDITAGIHRIVWSYEQHDGSSDINMKDTEVTVEEKDITFSNNHKTAEISFRIPAQARGYIKAVAYDRAENISVKNDTDKIIVVDTISPEVTITYEAKDTEAAVQYTDIDNNTVNSFEESAKVFYDSDVTANIVIREANFFEGMAIDKNKTVHDIAIKLTKTDADGKETVYEFLPEKSDKMYSDAIAQYIEWKTQGDEHSFSIAYDEEADYVLEISYADSSANNADIDEADGAIVGEKVVKTYKSKIITVDKTAPVVSVDYQNNTVINTINGRDYFKDVQTAVITVEEHNFRASDFDAEVTAADVENDVVGIQNYNKYLKQASSWKQNGNTYTATIVFDNDANYTFDYTLVDLAKLSAADYEEDLFTVDKTNPAQPVIKYETKVIDAIIEGVTFGYYKAPVTVTVIFEDATAGINTIEWKYTKEAGSSTLNLEEAGEIIEADGISYSNKGRTAEISFAIPAQARGTIYAEAIDRSGNKTFKLDAENRIVVDNIAPTRTVTYTAERVLDKETLTDVLTYEEGDSSILYYKDSAKVVFTVNEANFYAEDVVIKVNGEAVKPVDWTKNGDEWTGSITISGDGDYVVIMDYKDRSSNEMVHYESAEIRIDSAQPVIDVTYDNNDALNVNNYDANRVATIVIKEHNFRADDVNVTVTATDIQGNPVAVDDYKAYLSARTSWTSVGDVHTAKIEYSADARYTFDIEYSDIIGNAADDFAEESFVVDHVAPDEITITYSTPVIKKVLEKITFGFYKPSVTVTLSTADITSGVDYFTYTYTKQDGTSAVNKETETITVGKDKIKYSEDGKNAEYSFTIPAQARGYISAIATDCAGNSISRADKDIISVVDNISPEISIKYSAKFAETAAQFLTASNATVENFNDAARVVYGGNTIAEIVINEANFFEGKLSTDGVIHQIGIKLTATDDNGNVTVTEYLPADAKGLYESDKQVPVQWTTKEDTHSFTIEYAADSDYVLEVEYVDISGNSAEVEANDGVTAVKSYKSKTVTIDKTAPVIKVDYGNKNVIHTFDGRNYYDAVQTATITVTEHNFRAADFKAVVNAVNAIDENVAVEDFAKKLSSESAWTKDGNVYTAMIEYKIDANYTFDYSFKDLAENASAEYKEDLFTVDTKAPEKLSVSYTTSVLDKILESITFGYYNAEMTVTITAEDETTPISRFVYSYIKSEGVSEVNAELINSVVDEASKNIAYDGKKATVVFKIPKFVLADDNQFNGTVSFTAIDRAENSTDKDDNRRVVVDSIKPTATVTYNVPVKSVTGIAYYAADINAKIVITEANFYSEDVVVTVTKDGAEYPVSVIWTNDSVDVHTGTFTLTQDGDYIVRISYKDRSDNSMADYVSDRLTIDTKVPTVHVSDIVNNTANKDEKYGFTLTVEDINMDAATIDPVLTAVMRNEDGTYEIRNVSLGNRQTVTEGETYFYSVDNLTEDAYYTLTCSVQDMSGNGYEQIILEDGNAYSSVQFSVNRNGSVFAVSEKTHDMVEQYYVYSVYENIVIEEVNIDPLESYTVLLNGEALEEGTDYTVTRSARSGEWSKTTYSINKELFAEEGEYSIVVESLDKAQSTAYSDVKALNVAFVVDKTAPVIVISGLEASGRYHVEEQTVTLMPTDDGGRLNSLKVIISDSEGEPIRNENGEDVSVVVDMEGEELHAYLAENDGMVTFVIPSGLEQQVQVICKDCSVNDEGSANEFNETFDRVTVSASGLIIYYANKPLFYGSIAGTVLLTAVGIFFIYKKRKNK